MLSEEEKQAIEKNRTILLDFINHIRFDEEKHYIESQYYLAIEELNDKTTDLLNLIKKQQEEIDIYKEQLNKIDKVLGVKEGVAMPETSEIVKLLKDTVRDHYKEIEKKDKVIDLMAKLIDRTGATKKGINCIIKHDCDCNINGCEQCIKQYFINKVEGGE